MTRCAALLTEADDAVVVERAEGEGVTALRAEGERLEAARHPGVVAVLSSTGDDERWELRLAHGGRPVGLLARPEPTQVAGIVAAAAATVADLHAQGIVHGHLGPATVLLGPHGRVLLGGFGPDAGGAEAPDDVAALGALLVQLLGDREELEPLPDRRWTGRHPWSGVARRSLLTVADQACAEPPSRRPSAARLAAAIVQAVPAARVEPPIAEDGQAPARRVGLLLLVGVAAALSVGLLVSGAAPSGTEGPAEAAVPPLCVRLAPASSSGCEPVTVDGITVVVGERRFEVGEPGDVVVLGDWSCTGAATPALLRPATGEVFMFDRWALDGDVQVAAVARRPGATGARPVPSGPAGCVDLVVVGPEGTDELLVLGDAR